ncbi:MAG: type II toxin-antitoxin system prevent-host-death family antitoxin [Pseudomonadota bacterium]
MTIHVNIGEAKTRFSELCAAALRGEEVIVQNAGVPKLMLVALPEAAALDRADRRRRIDALLAEADKIPARPDAFDPLEWDEHGLPI